MVDLVPSLFPFYFIFHFIFSFILDIDKECEVTSCMTGAWHMSLSYVTQSCVTKKDIKGFEKDNII